MPLCQILAPFRRSQTIAPGGVNSPVRSFSKVGGQPLFKKAKGPFLFDEDGTKFIDYIGSWGPMILGHADDSVISSVKAAIDFGLSHGAPTEIETLLRVREFFPVWSQFGWQFLHRSHNVCD